MHIFFGTGLLELGTDFRALALFVRSGQKSYLCLNARDDRGDCFAGEHHNKITVFISKNVMVFVSRRVLAKKVHPTVA